MEKVTRRGFVSSAALGVSVMALSFGSEALAAEKAPSPSSSGDADAARSSTSGYEVVLGSYSGLTAREVSLAQPEGTYDVIVCGGGGSGLTAAYAALEQGASVLVIERADSCGGTTSLAEGAVQAAGTPWQKSLGKVNVEDDTADRHFQFWMNDSEGLVDPDLVRVMADDAADNLQWMADSFGITFSKVFGCYPASYTDTSLLADRIHLITDAADASKTGGVVWTTNAEAAVRGAGGEILTGTRVAGIIRDPADSSAAGVVTEDGRAFLAKRGVVLAMSGIEHNEQLARAFNPQQYWDLKTQAVATAATDTGDGIILGVGMGADIARFGGCVDLLLQTWSYTNNTNPEIPYILVNQRGNRFVREDTTYAFHCRAIFNACMQEGGFDDQTGQTGCVWMVMDSKMTGVSQASWSDPDKLQAALDDGSMVTADTVEGLAQQMGVSPDVLGFSVDKWNSDVAAGEDTLFGRTVQLTALDEPPFYAWKTVNTNIGSIGGLKIDTDAQVIDRYGEKIGHLFAAGTNSGGWLGPYYPGSGTCLQGTLNWGRIAGVSAAKA